MAALLREAGIEVRATPREAQRTVTLATLEPRDIPGLPAGFLVTDAHGRVEGLPGVFAAGDGTAHPIKQGGLACQQADAAAEQIAKLAGADIEPEPYDPVLRGMLLTEHWARFLRREGDRFGGRRPGPVVAADEDRRPRALGLSDNPRRRAGPRPRAACRGCPLRMCTICGDAHQPRRLIPAT